ncbi:hypothetical protein SAMN04515674_101392 [Pseudarcicella hirudinis]|uniref:Uncharacterized protein n=1 Tax=Pseudarcicella hirudinis TaxID=1079859 RepID=A0A1I5MPJ8_9BACT|nr:hypothetical protein SAMN04515674_101392 [Pseudarcicella hirudinis]
MKSVYVFYLSAICFFVGFSLSIAHVLEIQKTYYSVVFIIIGACLYEIGVIVKKRNKI